MNIDKNYRCFFLFLFLVPFMFSCDDHQPKITGYWKLNFSDSSSYSHQILHFHKENGFTGITIDEPQEGMFNTSGEKLFFAGDSLHFESLWGIYKYDGIFLSGDSILKGTRTTNNGNPAPFIMKRITAKELLYKIPRMNAEGEKTVHYSCLQPPQKDDGLMCSTLTEVGIDSGYIGNLIRDVLNGRMKTIHSLLIAKDNKLVLEEYFHRYDCDRLHPLESVTKSFTSALMGIAIDKNMVKDIDEPVWKYFPDRDSTQWVQKKYDIRIKNLLTMSAGLEWKPFTPNEPNDDIDIYFSSDYIQYILNKNLKDKPGSHFFYNNRLMYLQGHIIESTSGMTVEDFASNYLFNELGIDHFKWKVYENGIAETGGGLRMTPRDMMKFGLLYLNNGNWLGKQIISSEWVESSVKSQIMAGDQQYGYNWWIKSYHVNNKKINVFYALGHGEQTIMVIPEMQVVFVMTAGNFFNSPQRLDEIMTRYVLPALTNTPDIFPEDIIGNYKTNGDETIRIELVNDTLVATDPSGAVFRLLPASPDYYHVENSALDVKFLFSENDSIAEIYDSGNRVDLLRK